MATRRVSSSRRKNSTRSANPGTSAGAKKAWATRKKNEAAKKKMYAERAKKAAATRKANAKAATKPKATAKKQSASTRKTTTTKPAAKKTGVRRYSHRKLAMKSKSSGKAVNLSVTANPRRKRRRRRRKNGFAGGMQKGMFMLPKIGGVDTGAMVLGAGAAIAFKNIFNNLGFLKDNVINRLPPTIQPIFAPALVVIAGAAANKYAKNRHVKCLGAYAAAAAIVLAVDDLANAKIGEWVGMLGLGGGYANYGGGYVQLKGYGGTHVQLSGHREGSAGMFGGINNLA